MINNSWWSITSLTSSSCTLFFSSYTPTIFKILNLIFYLKKNTVVTANRVLGLCYGFINPKLNHFFFRMRGYSGRKFYINYWFSRCWIQKPNSVTDWWIQNIFFLIMKFWIWNACFCYGLMDLEIFFLNDGFLNVKCIFWITDWWIRNFTRSVNPKFFRIP